MEVSGQLMISTNKPPYFLSKKPIIHIEIYVGPQTQKSSYPNKNILWYPLKKTQVLE
jgi:hypothetical protein